MKTNINQTEKGLVSVIVPVLNELENVKVLNNFLNIAFSSKHINYEVIYIDDKYGPNKKPNGFQIYKLMARFYPSKQDADRGENGLIAEMQVTDRMSYYNHEIDEAHPAYHAAREEERKLLLPITVDRSRMNHVINTTSRKQLEVLDFSNRKLNEIFPQYLIFKDLDMYRKNASR